MVDSQGGCCLLFGSVHLVPIQRVWNSGWEMWWGSLWFVDVDELDVGVWVLFFWEGDCLVGWTGACVSMMVSMCWIMSLLIIVARVVSSHSPNSASSLKPRWVYFHRFSLRRQVIVSGHRDQNWKARKKMKGFYVLVDQLRCWFQTHW